MVLPDDLPKHGGAKATRDRGSVLRTPRFRAGEYPKCQCVHQQSDELTDWDGTVMFVIEAGLAARRKDAPTVRVHVQLKELTVRHAKRTGYRWRVRRWLEADVNYLLMPCASSMIRLLPCSGCGRSARWCGGLMGLYANTNTT